MAAIKALSRIAAKWAEVSSRAGAEYKEGVENPRRSWAQSTVAADELRKAGLVEADARGAFVKGVEAAGDAKWKSRASQLGPARFSSGVKVAEPDFSRGFSRYHGVISGVQLPPRGPKGSPENIDRVRAITEALHTEKVSA